MPTVPGPWRDHPSAPSPMYTNDPYKCSVLPRPIVMHSPRFRSLSPHGSHCRCVCCDFGRRQMSTPHLVKIFVGQIPQTWDTSMLLKLLHTEAGALVWLQIQRCGKPPAVFGCVKLFVEEAVVDRVLSLHHNIEVRENQYRVLEAYEVAPPGSTLLVVERSSRTIRGTTPWEPLEAPYALLAPPPYQSGRVLETPAFGH